MPTGKISLLESCPELAAEWHPSKNGSLTPSDVTRGSSKRAWWHCKKGHEWSAVIASRARGNGCPYCAGQRVIPGETDLATINPLLAAEWHPTKNGALTPDQVLPKAARKVWWQCAEGHEWEEKILNRANGRGCPFCSHHRVLPGQTDLSSVSPTLAAEWHPTLNGHLTPKDVLPKSGKKVWWLCPQGHEYERKVIDRTNGQGCPYCSHHKVLIGETDLATQYPAIASEWHPTKNTKLSASEVLPGSQKSVWWICPQGHEYQATIANRTGVNKTGCPYCSGRRVLKGFNDLKTIRPELVEEWDYEKNRDISPEELTVGSHRKVWWKCARGHSFSTSVHQRTSGGRISGCPQCNEAGTSFPEQAILYYLSRDMNTEVLSRERIAGVEVDIWIPELHTAIEYNGGYWHGKRLKNDLVKNEKLRAEGIVLIYIFEPGLAEMPCDYSIVLPSLALSSLDSSIITLENYLNINPNGPVDTAAEQIRILGNYKNSVREHSLGSLFPDAAKLWNHTKNDPLTPFMFSPQSNKRVWWLCPKGHEWEAAISDISRRPNCPYCSGKRVLTGFNDLCTVMPQVAKEWDFEKNGSLAPTDVTKGSNKRIWWKCEHGHEWQASIATRSAGNGCPYCSGLKAIPGETDLATTNPALAAQWHPTKNGELRPEMVKSRSGKRVWWICEKGHVWKATIASRSEGYGCPYCAGQKALPRETDLATLRPDLAAEWNSDKNGDLTPSDIMPGSGKKVWWTCPRGHDYEASPLNRSNGRGCPYCSGRRVLVGFNDLATVMPDLASQWHPTRNGELRPTGVTPGSGKKVWWLCQEGHEWAATIASRTHGAGCPYCAGNKKWIVNSSNDARS